MYAKQIRTPFRWNPVVRAEQCFNRQYPIEKLHEIYKAKIYKSFSFDEISNKSYEEFREEQEPELAKWSIDNDCSMFWKDDKEET